MINVIVQRVLPNNRVMGMSHDGKRVVGRYHGSVPIAQGEEVLFSEDKRTVFKNITQKIDLWRRATDEEATELVTALESQPVKLQMIFKDAPYISKNDPDYHLLRNTFVELFGEERTEELLEVSV